MMNKRIQELIVESGNGQFHNNKLYPHIGSRTKQDWEKFALLIIQECIQSVYDDGPDAEYYQNRIKHRFEVDSE